MDFLKSAAVGVVGVLLTAGVCGSAMAQTAPNAAPAPAATSSQPAAVQTAAAKPDPGDKVICKEEEETGSRLGAHRVCHTKRDWERISRDAGDMVDQATKARDPGRPQ